MTAIAINNLTAAADLNAVKGGWSEVLSVYLGSSRSFSNWVSKGTTYRYKGQVYVSGIGSAYKYDKKVNYERTERFSYNYESFWK